jgi:uncharacterized membrane protein (UPF0127 family)
MTVLAPGWILGRTLSRARAGSAFLACLVLLFGCTTTPPPAPLPVTSVTIDTPDGPAKFEVEIAADDVSRDYGLMNRKYMAPNGGMIFDFISPQMVMFWMKDTYIPLDMLFVDKDGRIDNIKHDATPFSLLPIPSAGPVRAVIEINGGRAKALGIEGGQTVHNTIFHNAR